MVGSMAGSAALHLAGPQQALHTVTLTVNNSCNLRCGHCYLQYSGPGGFIADAVLSQLEREDFSHLAVVGKEPLVNAAAATKTSQLIHRFAQAGKTSSLITNGLGIRFLSRSAISSLSWMDISLDGGPDSTEMYRGVPYKKIEAAAEFARSAGVRELNALQTLTKTTVRSLADMMRIASQYDTIVFSPFVNTRHQGRISEEAVDLPDLLKRMSRCGEFMEADNAVLLVGAHALPDSDDLEEMLAQYGLTSKTCLVKQDPLLLGLIRVTYEGAVLTPTESLHTDDYGRLGRVLTPEVSLRDIYTRLSSLALAA